MAVCFAFQRGECERGDGCRFLHESGDGLGGGGGGLGGGGGSGGNGGLSKSFLGLKASPSSSSSSLLFEGKSERSGSPQILMHSLLL